MNDGERERPGPIGIDALSEMGRRLLDVLGSVEQSFKRDHAAGTHSLTITTPRGRVAGTIGFRIRHGLSEEPDQALARRHPIVSQPKIDGSDGLLIDVFDEPGEILGALILQRALSVDRSGEVGPDTRAAATAADPADLLARLRTAREQYERDVVHRDERSKIWAGLSARWDKAITIAERFPKTPAPAPVIEPAATPPVAAGGSDPPAVRRKIDRGADNIKGSNFPPRPGFRPLVTNRQREALFGRYEYVRVPQPGNPEAIRILGSWERDNIVEVPIPQLRKALGDKAPPSIRFHRLAAGQLQSLWAEWDSAGLLDRILSFGGGFAARFVRGSRSLLSNHAFGSAFDLNETYNPFGQRPVSNCRKGGVRDLVPIANRCGFYWGGHYQSRTDGMHFEIAILERSITPQPLPERDLTGATADSIPAHDIAANAVQAPSLPVGASPPTAPA